MICVTSEKRPTISFRLANEKELFCRSAPVDAKSRRPVAVLGLSRVLVRSEPLPVASVQRHTTALTDQGRVPAVSSAIRRRHTLGTRRHDAKR